MSDSYIIDDADKRMMMVGERESVYIQYRDAAGDSRSRYTSEELDSL